MKALKIAGKVAGKVVGKTVGVSLTAAGVVGLGVAAAYWFDLDDKVVAGFDAFLRKMGKLNELKAAKAAYEASLAQEAK